MTKASIDDFEVRSEPGKKYGLYVKGDLLRTPMNNPVVSKQKGLLEWMIQEYREREIGEFDLQNGAIASPRAPVTSYLIYSTQTDFIDEVTGTGIPDSQFVVLLKRDPILQIWDEVLFEKNWEFLSKPLNKYLDDIGIPKSRITTIRLPEMLEKVTASWKSLTPEYKAVLINLGGVNNNNWIVSLMFINHFINRKEFGTAVQTIFIALHGASIDLDMSPPGFNPPGAFGKGDEAILTAEVCAGYLKQVMD